MINGTMISGQSPSDKPPGILLGMFQQLPVPAISRYLAQQGWDWLILDMQHGRFDYSTSYECCHVARRSGSKPLVRVPIGDVSAIQRVLDLGASGVVVPMVNSREEAEQAAQAAKYPPWEDVLEGATLGTISATTTRKWPIRRPSCWCKLNISRQ